MEKIKLTQSTLLKRLGLKSINELNGETLAPLIGSVIAQKNQAITISDITVVSERELVFTNPHGQRIVFFLDSQKLCGETSLFDPKK